MKKLIALSTILMALSAQAQENIIDLYADTWVATDGVGRKTPTSEEAPLKTDKERTVGIFYITWHTPNLHNGQPYKADVSKVLAEDPNASRDGNSPAWTIGSYHWGEPEYGYFLSQDKYVIRHDMSMLTDAGVDMIILDVTNAAMYWAEWEVMFQTMEEMKAEGNKVPKFCFWSFNGDALRVVQELYDNVYKKNRYPDLWFYWDGKPLLLYNAHPGMDANPGAHAMGDYSQEVKDFFTLRGMWWGYYEWNGSRYVGTEDNWSFGYQLNDEKVSNLSPKELCATHQGRMEEMAVTPAQHPISTVGKCWRRETGEPEMDQIDMPKKAFVPWLGEEREDPVQYGIYFQDRWDEALSVDPDFIYLNDWNEWTAGKYPSGFAPGSTTAPGPDGFLDRKNPFYFVDQYNAEYNRTISPMKGGYTDNYYMQMVQNIRKYKGVREIPRNKGFLNMQIDGSFEDWKNSSVEYRDTRNDIVYRDHDGYGDLHYTNTTGRNDIVCSKVAMDKQNVYFYVETAGPMSSYADPNWMLLLVDSDTDSETGWEGYDFLINKKLKDTSHTSMMRWNNRKQEWVEIAELNYRQKGNQMEICVPRSLLKAKGKEVTFDFKWADNPQTLENIISLCTDGDAAPNRRFNFRFLWEK